MTVEGVNMGARLVPATIKPEFWGSVGFSMAGAVAVQNFGIVKFDMNFFFMVSATTLASVQSALHAIGKGGLATVVPDSGDDMGIGRTTSTELIFMEYEASFVGGDQWSVRILFNYLS